ncbi:hypothetical protein TNCV_3178281 [Trichonephila clavipes]|nr:hypothetical protein TNCV_3178281 [Trichonephila clavipes]
MNWTKDDRLLPPPPAVSHFKDSLNSCLYALVCMNVCVEIQVPQCQKNEDDTGVNVENHNVFRPPPPITIGNVNQSNKLLKKLQDITKQKLRGRIIGKGLRVYTETPEAYHAIRRYFDSENLEAFTYQLNEEKELKAVEGKKELRYPTSRHY